MVLRESHTCSLRLLRCASFQLSRCWKIWGVLNYEEFTGSLLAVRVEEVLDP